MKATLERPKPVSNPADALEAKKALNKKRLGDPALNKELLEVTNTISKNLKRDLEHSETCLCKACRQYRGFQKFLQENPAVADRLALVKMLMKRPVRPRWP